jgi:hypothetical protein
MDEIQRRIPKCRYELRVNLFQIEYAALKERLASVYGFEVSVYEDRDGDLISLSRSRRPYHLHLRGCIRH